MSLKIISSKLTGTPDASGWSQVHEFTPQDEDKFKIRGHLLAVLGTSKSEKEISDVVVGRECLTRLHEEYFGNLEKSAFNALKDALEKVAKEFEESLGPLEIAAASFLDNIVYSAAINGAEVAIFRNGMFAKIIESKTGVISASGYPKSGDLLILGTKNFFSEIPVGSLRAALMKEEPEAAVELLAPQVRSSNFASRIGSVVIMFKETPVISIGDVFDNKKEVPDDSPGVLEKHKIVNPLHKLTNLLAKILPAKKIYVNFSEEENRFKFGRKTTFIAGVVLLLLLTISIVLGLRQKNISDYQASYKEELTKASHDLEEALNLNEIDPTKARGLFEEARQIGENLDSRGIKDENLTALLSKIKENEGSLLGEYRENSELFVDLSLLTDNFIGEKITYSEGEIFILDPNSKKVVNIIAANKKSKVFAGPSKLGNVKEITSYVDRLFALEDDGVYEIADKRQKVVDKDWKDDALIYAYGANIYILDKTNSDILRFAGTEKGFSNKQRWLSPGTNGDFSDVISWAIDGSIWTLTSKGEIVRYGLGNKVGFETKGTPFEPVNPAFIYTNEGLKYLYVLLPERSTIVLFSKEGQYQAQYISDSIGEAKGFIVTGDDGKIIVLTGEKLFSIDLRNK